MMCLYIHTGKESEEEKLAFLQLCSLMMQKKGIPSNVLVYIYEEFQVQLLYMLLQLYTWCLIILKLFLLFIFIDVRGCSVSGTT